MRDAGITGFAIVSGDRHSFWAGYAAKSLPPEAFDPVGLSFITGSISSPGRWKPSSMASRAIIPCARSTWPIGPASETPHPTVNLLMQHGVRSCLEYARSGDLAARPRRASNPDLAPHLYFLDMGGHGYATLRLSATEAEYRVRLHPPAPRRSSRARTAARSATASPTAPASGAPARRPGWSSSVIEGDPGLSI